MYTPNKCKTSRFTCLGAMAPCYIRKAWQLHDVIQFLALRAASFAIVTGGGEGAPIHMFMIRLETVENHRMYCLMPSDNFIVKKSGIQAGIKPTTFGVPTHCSNH